MNPEQRVRALRTEADEVMRLIRLEELCSFIGKPVPTGSYMLDLMMYPDIDLYLPPASIEQLFRLGAMLASHERVSEVVFEKGDQGELAGCYYLKPRIQYGNWGRPWKIDIWSVPESLIAKKQAGMEDMRSRITAEQRRLIIDYKFSILTPEKRTPMFSGIFIYRAVVDRGMTDHRRITKYLKDNGIKM